jgi:FkbM family methyltransferase
MVISSIRISVVIPAREACTTIRYCLKSLNMQVRKPDEVIIVINPPDDPTRECVEELLPELSFNVKILTGPGGVGSARGIGVANALGEIVAFIDSDEVAHPYWLYYIEKAFAEHPNVMVTGGPIVYVEDICQILSNPPKISEPFLIVPGDINNIRTGNMAFRKTIINMVGNFDPQFKVCHEDTDFKFRLIDNKIKMFYCRNIIVYHIRKKIPILKEIHKSFYIGAHNAKLFIKHPKIRTLKIFYMNLGHAFLIALGIIVAIITGTVMTFILIVLPSILYKIIKVLIRKDLKLMIRRLTQEYIFQLLFTLGFLIEITKITLGEYMPKQLSWLILHILTVKIPHLIIRFCKKELLPYWLYILPDGNMILGPLSPEIFTIIWEIYHKRSYELSSFMRSDMIVIDCGAHIGLYSLKMAKSSKKIISIEPEERNFHFLTLNIRLNRLTGKTYPLKVAISDKDGFTTLFTTRRSVTHSIIRADGAYRAEGVKTITLDTLIRKLRLDSIDVLKLDIEGAELLALKGLEKEAKSIRNIVLEAHTKIVNVKDLMRELSSKDFTVINITKIPGMCNSVLVYATRTKD